MNRWRIFLGTGVCALLSLFCQGCGGGRSGVAAVDPEVISSVSGLVSSDGTLAPSIGSVGNLSLSVGSTGGIKDAIVFIDLDGDGIRQDGEPYTTTDDDGRFKINYILENSQEYTLVARGTASGNTPFVMYTTFTTAPGIRPVAVNYSRNISPRSFQEYLQKLDNQFYGALGANSDLRAFLQEDDKTQLFTRVLNTKAAFEGTLQEVAEYQQQQEEIKKSSATGTDLGLAGTPNIVFSAQSSTVLTSSTGAMKMLTSIAFADKTFPAKVGDMVISSNLAQVQTTAAYRVFVTSYKSILEVPNFAFLRNNNHTIVYGADITVRDGNGQRLTGTLTDQVVKNDIIKAIKPGADQSGLCLLDFDGLNWQERGCNFSISNGSISGLTITTPLPIILTRKETLKTYTVSVPAYTTTTNPVVVIRGYYSGVSSSLLKSTGVLPGDAAAQSGTIILDYVVMENGQAVFKLPPGFVVQEIVLLDNEIMTVSSENKASLKLEVKEEEGIPVVAPSDPLPFVFIRDTELLDILLRGSLIEYAPGLEALIETRIAYQYLSISREITGSSPNANTARNLITANSTAFLGGNNSFISQGLTDLSWSENRTGGAVADFTFTVSASSARLELLENVTNPEDKTLFRQKTNWHFTNGEISKTVEQNRYEDEKTGSVLNINARYSRAAPGRVAAAFTVNIMDNYLSQLTDYRNDMRGVYVGTSIFSHDSAYGVSDVLNAKYTHNFRQWSSVNGAVQGGVNSLDGTVDIRNGELEFTGDYNFYLERCGEINGRAVLGRGAKTARGYHNGFYNNNALAAATFTAKKDPQNRVKNVSADLIGSWEGVLTDSCYESGGQMIVIVSQSYQSWTAQSGTGENDRRYGSGVFLNDNNLIFYDKARVFSGAKLMENGKIEGSWTSGFCRGSFSLSRY